MTNLELENIDDNRWINESNDLILSIIKLNTTELSLFLFIVSFINPMNFNGTVIVSKSKIYDFFDAVSNSRGHWFKKTLTSMISNSLFTLPEDRKLNRRHSARIMITDVTWSDYDDDVEVVFNKHIIPYISDLTKYTKTDLRDIKKIRNNRTAIVLYRLINMNYRQYNSYKDRKNRTPQQLESLKNPIIDEQTLRDLTLSQGKYKRFIDLDIKLVEPAINEINLETKYDVTYERVRKGRKPIGFKFYVTEKNIAPLPQNMKSREEIEKEFAEQFAKAFSSPYLMKLASLQLISTPDMTNQEFHVKLLEDVYPLYDQIRNSKDSYGVTGEELLDKHLEYVVNKMYSPTDVNRDKGSIPSGFALVKYLKKAAMNFIGSQLSPL